ncbi:hypothetical protein CCH79_00004768, partial [Gambusia affinis]
EIKDKKPPKEKLGVEKPLKDKIEEKKLSAKGKSEQKHQTEKIGVKKPKEDIKPKRTIKREFPTVLRKQHLNVTKLELEIPDKNVSLTKTKVKAVPLRKVPEAPKETTKPTKVKKVVEVLKKKKIEPITQKKAVIKAKPAPAEKKKEKTVPKQTVKDKVKEDRVLKEKQVPAKKDELPYFQCFFLDEDEAQFPFYAFSPLHI